MRRRVVLGIGIVLLLVFCLASWALFLRPWRADLTRGADAVLVLAGGGPRIEGGVALVEDGVAPLLLLSDGAEEGWEEVEEICATEAGYEIVCFTPDPANTAGEARGVGRIAQERSLGSLIMVTVPTHARRAQLRVERCTEARVQVATVSQQLSPVDVARAVAKEWAGMAQALLLQRAC